MRAEKKQKSTSNSYAQRVLFGCLTAAPRLALTQPFETTLARVQANPSLSVSEVIKKVLSNRGVKGFYDGSIPTFSRYVAMKFFGTPVMTYTYDWSKLNFSESNSYAPPLITSFAMAGHDWLAISYMNYKFFQKTLNTKVEYKNLWEAAYGIYNSSRALPILQAYRWLSFLTTRELWKNSIGESETSVITSLGSAAFSAVAHCFGVPFLERLNNAVNKDISNKNKSLFDIASAVWRSEGVKNVYVKATPFVFANSFITLLIWDVILSSCTKSELNLQKTQQK